ncbi:MAG: autotransporter-associated beta strand repeat-containing protein [Burkholderiales bacterium]|nr:autotransporter-associated beta strand repeat-containing protein [Opitutaceae bacterium]
MKSVKTPSFVLLAAFAALSASSTVFAQRNLPVAETFTSFTAANLASLPANFYVEAGDAITWRGNGTSETGAGFWALGSGTERAFGILETSSFGDARLALEIKNNGSTPITQLNIKYKVEQWRDGVRVNSIKLKYNPDSVTQGVLPGGFSELPELVVTSSPKTANNDTGLDGNASGNFTSVNTTIVLTQPLNQNNLAWVRWQFSTTSGSGTRDKLAIDEIEVADATPVGTPLTWVGDAGDWASSGGSDWSGGAWNNGGNSTAVFSNTPVGTVSLVNSITATNLEFSVGDYVIDRGGSEVLTLKGLVKVDDGTGTDIDATIAVPIAGTVGLVKTGADTLVITSGSHTYTGTTSVAQGTLAFDSGASAALPASSPVFVADNATFDLGGGNRTRSIASLSGGSTGVVEITDNTLEINNVTSGSYKGNITGTGNVVKKGAGNQKFRNQVKTYSGTTTVENGILDVTENSNLTNTSSVTVTGATAELRLSTDVANSTTTLGTGSLTLASGGSLASETDNVLQLASANNIVIGTGGGFIFARGIPGKLTLNGKITGSGALTRKGQGELVINGGNSTDTNAVSANVLLNNGLTTIPSGKVFGNGSITVTVQGANSSERASIRGAGTVSGNLAFASNSLIDLAKVSGVTVVTGNVTGLTSGNVTISGTGTNVNVFRVLGTVNGSLPSGVTVVSASPDSGNYIRITK